MAAGEPWIRVEPAAAPGAIRVLLARPPANAFTLRSYKELGDAIAELSARAEPPTCVLLGSAVPRFFSGGRDTEEARSTAPDDLARRRQTVTRLYRLLFDLPMPVIAVIDGYALGAGMVIASLCDLRIASDEARFGLPEIAGGTVGGARHLLRVLPQGTVRHLALTGEHLSAERARELGFVEQVVPSASLWDQADRLAASICGFDPSVTAKVKQVLNETEELPLWDGFAHELAAGTVGPRRQLSAHPGQVSPTE